MISEDELHNAVGPLRRVFWGALLCLIDFKINGFDLFPDVLGMFLVAIGVTWLAGVSVSERYRAAMWFVTIMAWLNVLVAIVELFHTDRTVLTIISLIAFVSLIATALFCVSMRWFCEIAGLARSAASWRTTTLLYSGIYVIPLGMFYLAGFISQLTGSRWSFSVGMLPALAAIAVLLLPLIHFFISTTRMKNEMLFGDATPYTGHGFEVLPPRDDA